MLGHLRAMLGPGWAILGPSWAYLGPSWGHLGSSWSHVGPSRGSSWAILGLCWGRGAPPRFFFPDLWCFCRRAKNTVIYEVFGGGHRSAGRRGQPRAKASGLRPGALPTISESDPSADAMDAKTDWKKDPFCAASSY